MFNFLIIFEVDKAASNCTKTEQADTFAELHSTIKLQEAKISQHAHSPLIQAAHVALRYTHSGWFTAYLLQGI